METVKKALGWAAAIVQRSPVLRRLRNLRHRARPEVARPQRTPPKHDDERSMRRAAERDAGGMSSARSVGRYAGRPDLAGTHRGKRVLREGPEHQRPELDEPQAREERTLSGEDHIPEKRSGA
jgi:hypothetical protein